MTVKLSPRDEMSQLATEAKSIAEMAERKQGGVFTQPQVDRINQLKSRADELRPTLEAARNAEGLLADLAKDDGDDFGYEDQFAGGYRKARVTGGSRWAKAVIGRMTEASAGLGTKALLSGQVDTPSTVEVVELPAVPTRLLDLVAREELTESNNFSYLRQIVRTNNAAVVADNETKPTSVMTFKEIEDRARVIAHLSEPFPLRYLSDHTSMADVLDGQMVAGVIEELEAQLVSGDGLGENFTGIFSTTGVTQVPFATDALTTARRARTILGNKGENPTAWVFNPTDLESFDLLREDGATGGFLMDSAAAATIFGPGPKIPSLAVPVGTALLADWRTLRIRVRQGAHTLAATQAGDLFKNNQVMLRSEGRFGLEIKRPQAIAVVDLAAA